MTSVVVMYMSEETIKMIEAYGKAVDAWLNSPLATEPIG